MLKNATMKLNLGTLIKNVLKYMVNFLRQKIELFEKIPTHTFKILDLEVLLSRRKLQKVYFKVQQMSNFTRFPAVLSLGLCVGSG